MAAPLFPVVAMVLLALFNRSTPVNKKPKPKALPPLTHDDPSLDDLAASLPLESDDNVSNLRPPAEPSKSRPSQKPAKGPVQLNPKKLKPTPEDYAAAKIETAPSSPRQQAALLKSGKAIPEVVPTTADDAGAGDDDAGDDAAAAMPKLGRDPFEPPTDAEAPGAVIETMTPEESAEHDNAPDAPDASDDAADGGADGGGGDGAASAPTMPSKPTLTSTAKAPAAPSSAKRSKQQAAADLRDFLNASHRFGSATDKPSEIRDAQRDLGVASDGIVGPKTRAAAQAAGVTLPPRTAAPKPAAVKKPAAAKKPAAKKPAPPRAVAKKKPAAKAKTPPKVAAKKPAAPQKRAAVAAPKKKTRRA